MRNEKNSNDKRAQARNLYFESDLTQAQIAKLLGLSQKTISQYISEEKWKFIKDRAQQMPGIFLEQMNSELQDINDAIAARPKGERHATSSEAEVRRKILNSMASIKERQSTASHIEVLINFISIVAEENLEDAQLLNKYIYDYISGVLVPAHEGIHTYGLPGDEDMPPETQEDSTKKTTDASQPETPEDSPQEARAPQE